MPKYAQPELSPATQKAMRVFGVNAAHVAVLSAIRTNPGLTSGQIADIAGLPPATARTHLTRLVNEGMVIATPPLTAPHSQRRGVRPTYVVDESELYQQWLQLGAEFNLPPANSPVTPEM